MQIIIKDDAYVSSSSPDGGTSTSDVRKHCLRTKSAVYDCILFCKN